MSDFAKELRKAVTDKLNSKTSDEASSYELGRALAGPKVSHDDLSSGALAGLGGPLCEALNGVSEALRGGGPYGSLATPPSPSSPLPPPSSSLASKKMKEIPLPKGSWAKSLVKGRNAALEEAAQVAEAYKRREYGPRGTEWVSCEEADDIAKEIRDLKTDSD